MKARSLKIKGDDLHQAVVSDSASYFRAAPISVTRRMVTPSYCRSEPGRRTASVILPAVLHFFDSAKTKLMVKFVMYLSPEVIGEHKMLDPVNRSSSAVTKNYEQSPLPDCRAIKIIADQFRAALNALESDRQIEPLVALFAADGTVGNSRLGRFDGREQITRFWTADRALFGDVRTVFLNEVHFENEAKLHWRTEGIILAGCRIRYEGVTVLETDGAQITRCYAYFDQECLQKQLEAAC